MRFTLVYVIVRPAAVDAFFAASRSHR